MPILERGRRRIRYELDSPAEGPADGPVFVLVNGLTQYIELWEPYRYMLVAKGFRVVTFDLLGQGISDKPSLHITQDDQVAVLYDLIAELEGGPIFLAGISFGGVIALRYAIAHSDTIAGLVPISSFAELPPQLYLLGSVMRTGLILGGTSFLMDMLFPMNLSNEWLSQQMHALEMAKRRGWLLNDVYALQNLMKSFLEFEPMTPHLSSITRPDHDPERRVRFSHPAVASGIAARAHSGQRIGVCAAGLSRVHAGEAGIDRRLPRAFCPRRDVGPLAREEDGLDRARRTRRRFHAVSRRLRPHARDTGSPREAPSC